MKHFVFTHNIEDINHFKEQIEKAEKLEKTKIEFRKYVEELTERMRKGEISGKDYRELTEKWRKEHQ